MTTFVLIHRGIQGGWVWKRVVALLRAAGHEVYVPTPTRHTKGECNGN
jgi:hypothetical protein